MVCLSNNADIFKDSNQINLNLAKNIFYKQNQLNDTTLEEEMSLLISILDKFVEKKILERELINPQNSAKKMQFNYYLKLNPKILLQII